VREGRSAALVVRGEAGIGKTTLLKYAKRSASDCRIVKAAGIESEMELAFGGLHQLCAPFLDHLGELPVPQRLALETAFGLSSGTPPDRFLVGLAVLTLMTDVVKERPLVCLVDDAQRLTGSPRKLSPSSLDAWLRTRSACSSRRESPWGPSSRGCGSSRSSA
jgi:hypothetical protein